MTLSQGVAEPKGADAGIVVPLSKQRLRVWLRLLDSNREILGRLRGSLRTEFDTTLPRFDVMATLDRYRDGLRMSHLSAHLKVSNGNVTGIVDSLIHEGLVTRRVDSHDKRATTVRLTRHGIESFAAMARAHERWIDTMFTELDSHALDQLSSLLDQLHGGPK
ncbi:MAG: MarR family winged helix-turn-helix transcriptional regulator [Pseudomonadota bacterium]|nr:MarR family winged helix-turn-helix transcriptional regulator [Pseudomonadota bacterium]